GWPHHRPGRRAAAACRPANCCRGRCDPRAARPRRAPGDSIAAPPGSRAGRRRNARPTGGSVPDRVPAPRGAGGTAGRQCCGWFIAAAAAQALLMSAHPLSLRIVARGRRDLEPRGRSDEMVHFVGLDVSVKATSVCVVDDAGKVIVEQKVPTEPADIIALLTSL